MAQVIEPISSVIETTQVFTWSSADGSYCWQNYLQITDNSGSIIYDSGLFNPNGSDSTVRVTDLPDNGSPFEVLYHCNPSQTRRESYSLATDNQPPDSPQDSVSVSSDAGDIIVNVVLDSSELEAALTNVLTDFSPELFSLIQVGGFTAMVVGLTGGFIYKAIRQGSSSR